MLSFALSLCVEMNKQIKKKWIDTTNSGEVPSPVGGKKGQSSITLSHERRCYRVKLTIKDAYEDYPSIFDERCSSLLYAVTLYSGRYDHIRYEHIA